MAWVIDSPIVPTQRMRVDVETDAEFSYGRTVCDLYGVTGREPNAEVGTGLDVDRFWALMIGAIASYRESDAA